MSELEKLELAKAKEFLNIQDVALLSNLSISTIRRNIAEGKLKTIDREDPRQKYTFKKKDVISWISNGYSVYKSE